MSEVSNVIGRPQKPAKSPTVTKRATKFTASRERFDKLASRRVISNKNDKFIELAYTGKFKLLEDLLRKGQAVDALHSYTQTTALSAAIDRGQYATARTLLKWKADPNYRHPVTGETPLHRAAARGDPRIVKCLLENNPRADRHIISVANQKPMTIAREYQWLEVSDILREPPSQPLVINVEVTPSTALFTWNSCADNGTPIEVYELVWRISKYQSNYCTGIDPVTKIKFWHHRVTHEELWAKPKEPEEDPQIEVAKNEDAPVKPGGLYANHWNFDSSIEKCTYFLENLHPAYQYFMLLRARSAAGWGVFSRVIPFSCSDDITNEPSAPLLWSMTARAISLCWDRPTVDNGGHIIFYELKMAKVKLTDKRENPESFEWVTISDDIRGEPKPKYRVNDLMSGACYCFVVRGRNKTGWSLWSPFSDIFQTNSSPSLLHRSKHSITIHWMDWKLGSPENIKYFEVQYYALPLAPEKHDEMEFDGDECSDDLACRLGIESHEVSTLPWKTCTATLQDNRYMLDGLQPAHEFVFRVRTCFNDHGWDKWENAGETKVFKTKDSEPDPPTPPMFVSGSVTHDSTVLRWGDSRCNGQPIDGYQVFWRPKNEEEWTLAENAKFIPRKDVEGKAAIGLHVLPGEFQVTGLMFDTEYQYATRAHNSLGWSLMGKPSSYENTLALEPPSRPRCVYYTDTLAKIEWDPPTTTGRPVDKYNLEQRRWRLIGGLYSPTPWVLVARSAKNTYLANGLKATVQYEFRVRAHTYAADLPAQWSQPSDISQKVEMLRRL